MWGRWIFWAWVMLVNGQANMLSGVFSPVSKFFLLSPQCIAVEAADEQGAMA